MRRASFVLLVLVALPAAALGQPTDPALARTDPAIRQVPARDAGFGASGRNAGEMPRIDQSDLNRMTDQQRGNRAGEMRQITPRDLEMMRQEQRNREIDPFRRNDNVRQLEPGRDIPTPEQAREMQRRSAEIQRQAEDNFRRAAELDARTSQALRNSMERSRAIMQGAIERGLAAANIALQAWQILHPSDHTCLSNTSPAAMPIVPSMCAGSAECASCYSQAYGRLDRTRGNLEKLRCIYDWNKEYSERQVVRRQRQQRARHLRAGVAAGAPQDRARRRPAGRLVRRQIPRIARLRAMGMRTRLRS